MTGNNQMVVTYLEQGTLVPYTTVYTDVQASQAIDACEARYGKSAQVHCLLAGSELLQQPPQ